MKLLRRILLFLVVLVGLFLTALYFIAPNMILYPMRNTGPQRPDDYHLPYQKITVHTPDSIDLKAYWIHDTLQKRPVVILLHGISNCKESWMSTAAWLWEQGFSVVMMDLRAHGESGGKYCTYGYLEKKDIAALTTFLLQRDSSLKIGIWGHSLGGAVALQSLAYDPRLQFGIVESAFADFRNIVYDYQWRMFKVSSHTFADWAIERAAATAHYYPDSIRPMEAARMVHQPVLMTHGSDDERISISYGKRNYNNLASTDKQFYEVAGANHNNLSAAGGRPYFSAILTFLKRQ